MEKERIDNKATAMSYGFWQLPTVIATSKHFTPTERLILAKVFDLMWRNKETKDYKNTCFPANGYLAYWCDTSEKTISRLKKNPLIRKMFAFQKRYDDSDIWILKDIPDELLAEYEWRVEEWDRIKPKTKQEIAEELDEKVARGEFGQNVQQKGQNVQTNGQKVLPNYTKGNRRTETEYILPGGRSEETLTANTEATLPLLRSGVGKSVSSPPALTHYIEDEAFSIEEKQFLHTFETEWRRWYGSKYIKHDHKRVHDLTESKIDWKEAVELIELFHKHSANQRWIKDSDHSLTVFVDNYGSIKQYGTGESKELQEARRAGKEYSAECDRRDAARRQGGAA
jgi:hypothetical protein